MRHRKDHRKLGRNHSHRRALLRNLVTALFQYERIETTVAKAKEARRVAERMITFGKRGDLVQKGEPEMLKFRNFGRKSLKEIQDILGEMGLHFGMDVSRYYAHRVPVAPATPVES